MKIKLERLDFHRDPEFDKKHVVEDLFAYPCLVKYKKHWWSLWKYIMDYYPTTQPKLFYGTDEEVLKFAKGFIV